MPAPLTLSTVNPDHEDIRAQLEAYLATIDSWKGVVTGQTGQGIINMIAAVGAFSQATIRRKYEDSFPETVVSDSASYALADMQGVRLTRKLPASVGANLTSTMDLTIPAFSTFQGSGAFFFNREAIFLLANVPTSVVLYEGKVQSYATPGLGQNHSMFASNESGFEVSDVDVSIRLETTVMNRTTGGLWTLRNQIGFGDYTLPDGRLLIQFGTQDFGGVPASNQTLYITYVVTVGADGNSLDTNGKNLTAPDFGSVTGVFTSSPSGGANEKAALTYKNLAATTFGAFDSAITRQQYITTALSYPGVIDVVTFAQREVNPSAKEWMNLIKVVMLTSSVWSPTDKQNFIDWMQDRSAYSPVFFLEDPSPQDVDIDLDIYCFSWANSTEAKQNAIAAVNALFTPRAGLLNYDLRLTDITSAIMNSDKGIEFVVLRSPSSDVIISPSPLDPPVVTQLLGSGTIPAATTYYYSIAAITPLGTVTIKNFGAGTTTTINNRLQVVWESYPGATSYEVYRRDSLSSPPLKLATVTAPTVSYIDTGGVTPSGAPLPQSTVPVRYINLNPLNVVDKYSSRILRV